MADTETQNHEMVEVGMDLLEPNSSGLLLKQGHQDQAVWNISRWLLNISPI